MRYVMAGAAALVLGSCGGGAGTIGEACLESGRSAANPRLCGCVQGVASQTLSRSEQRRAAEFFADPQGAQDARMSSSASTEAFWERYAVFASEAERLCR